MASPTQTVVGKGIPNLLTGFAKNSKGPDPAFPTKVPYQFPSMEW